MSHYCGYIIYGGFDGLYSPTDNIVANWNSEYEISTQDTNNGVLIGRYEADSYDGCLNIAGERRIHRDIAGGREWYRNRKKCSICQCGRLSYYTQNLLCCFER